MANEVSFAIAYFQVWGFEKVGWQRASIIPNRYQDESFCDAGVADAQPGPASDKMILHRDSTFILPPGKQL